MARPMALSPTPRSLLRSMVPICTGASFVVGGVPPPTRAGRAKPAQRIAVVASATPRPRATTSGVDDVLDMTGGRCSSPAGRGGVGRGITEAFLARGADVVICGRHRARGRAVGRRARCASSWPPTCATPTRWPRSIEATDGAARAPRRRGQQRRRRTAGVRAGHLAAAARVDHHAQPDRAAVRGAARQRRHAGAGRGRLHHQHRLAQRAARLARAWPPTAPPRPGCSTSRRAWRPSGRRRCG